MTGKQTPPSRRSRPPASPTYRAFPRGSAATRSKYGNVATTLQGIRFHSKREGLRWLVLKDMERQGDIRDLQRQRIFRMVVNGKLICKYIADFTYYLRDATRLVVEDSKGVQTQDFRIKWKLGQALHPEIDWRIT